MADSPSSSAPTLRAEDRLYSWKEIAAYLNRDVTTVQRWEKREGMPVHRHQHDRIGSVFASRAELDAWAHGRSRNEQEEEDAAVATEPPLPTNHALRYVLLAAFSVVLVAGAGVLYWLQKTEFFWRNPVADAHFQRITDFDGVTGSATVSADGHLIAFLSARDGQMDVWLTQAGSGEFHNLTHGQAPVVANSDIRALGFTPDNSQVTFWVSRGGADGIGIWAVPILGGEVRPYLEGAGELAWSHDNSRLAYHTPGPGDPLFVSRRLPGSLEGQPIFTAPPGLHSHFPIWSPDDQYIYFARGSLPDKLDIWRVAPSGGSPQRITFLNARVLFPVLLDNRRLLYLAADSDGSGPWLYEMDVNHGIPHRLSAGPDRYTSLGASADGRRLVLTLATPRRTLWRASLSDSGGAATEAPTTIPMSTGGGFSPRIGPDYLVYLSTDGSRKSVWKISNGLNRQLWSEEDVEFSGGPAVSRDGKRIAFSVRREGKSLLYAINDDGTAPRVLTDALELQGSPAWNSDGRLVIVSANDRGIPHLFRVSVDGDAPTSLVTEYSIDPASAPDGSMVLYSGADVGTAFSVKAVTLGAVQYALPPLTLTRGARHIAFVGAQKVLVLRGDLQHKNVWLIDLANGSERQITNFPSDFDVRDFDVSPDGRELVFERYQDRSDIVMMDLPRN